MSPATVALALYAARRRAGLTQRELARRMGTTASAVSRAERDWSHFPSLDFVARVAAATGERIVLVAEPPDRPDLAARHRAANAARPYERRLDGRPLTAVERRTLASRGWA